MKAKVVQDSVDDISRDFVLFLAILLIDPATLHVGQSVFSAVSLFWNKINLVEHLASRLLVKQYTRLPPKRCVFNKSPSPHALIASDLCKKKKKEKVKYRKKLRFLR